MRVHRCTRRVWPPISRRSAKAGRLIHLKGDGLEVDRGGATSRSDELALANRRLARKVSRLEARNRELEAHLATINGRTQDAAAYGSREASLARIGQIALGVEDLQALFDHAAQTVAASLNIRCSAIFSYHPARGVFFLEAGQGWAKGLIGRTAMDARDPSELRRAFEAGGPVSIRNVDDEDPSRLTDLLKDHEIKSVVCAPIGPMVDCWGVLGAYAEMPAAFGPDDNHFLSSIVNFLWLAINRQRAQAAIDGERQQLRQLTDGLPLQVSVIDRTLRYELNNKAYEAWGWPREEIEGMAVEDLVGEEIFEKLREPISEVLEGGRPTTFELDVRYPGGARRTNLVHYVPRRDGGGGIDGLYSAAVDITERKEIERSAAIISAELDHRVKNILAIVNSIAHMTGKDETSIDVYRETFEARIEALARTHTALASSAWKGMQLRDVLAYELQAYRVDACDPISFDGPDVYLQPKPAQAMAMAFHELATNAVKYGALAEAGRTLAVRWRVEENDGEAMFSLLWQERGLASLLPPEREGFGTSITRDATRIQLGADVELAYESDGLSFSIRCPLSHVSNTE